jgi:hypothetical protein
MAILPQKWRFWRVIWPIPHELTLSSHTPIKNQMFARYLFILFLFLAKIQGQTNM